MAQLKKTVEESGWYFGAESAVACEELCVEQSRVENTFKKSAQFSNTMGLLLVREISLPKSRRMLWSRQAFVSRLGKADESVLEFAMFAVLELRSDAKFVQLLLQQTVNIGLLIQQCSSPATKQCRQRDNQVSESQAKDPSPDYVCRGSASGLKIIENTTLLRTAFTKLATHNPLSLWRGRCPTVQKLIMISKRADKTLIPSVSAILSGREVKT
ncbi:hypothetical protein Ciccas_001540 [Cichlidogyrus casuarinus]|uniref:Uncharacterized protein n=1 Tax=Cichlidogyrus casuarinus TaxID=1844966 RepID=A0ABD2QJR3_9PLAT